MVLEEQIRQMFKEIKIYSLHALYEHAKHRCVELSELIKSSDRFKQKEALLEVISRKIDSIEEEARCFDGVGGSAKMSEKEMDVVKRLVFVSAESDKNASAWEVAKAFIILGQFDEALQKFQQLIDCGYKHVSAAKHALRCQIGMSAVDEAIATYKQWFTSGKFTLEELENIRTFFQEILAKKNILKALPKPNTDLADQTLTPQEDEFIDIISVKLTTKDASNKKSENTLEVAYQKGAMVSVVVPGINKSLLDYLESEKELQNVEFHSSSIIFNEACLVSKKELIASGLKKGDYSVCMIISGVEESIDEEKISDLTCERTEEE